jgi:CheY-like chemotaxis protein
MLGMLIGRRPMKKESSERVAVSGDAAAVPASAAPRPAAHRRGLLAARVPLRILAADDVRTNREFLRQLTAFFGYQVEIVENGAEVLAALSRRPFDLVLLDIQMPVLDGLGAAREVVRRQPDPCRRPKIVALTANSEAGDQAACRAAGMDDCLSKPISPRAFEACVVRLFTETPFSPQPEPLPVPKADIVLLPLVDFKHLESTMSGLYGAQLVAIQRRMHRAVAKDFETIWPRVVEAVSHQDQGQLAETLHALKGCFSAMGWDRIAGRCAEALQQARSLQFADWATIANELQQLYAASTAEMTRYLAKAEASPTETPPPDA